VKNYRKLSTECDSQKNSENRSIIGKDMDKSKVACFMALGVDELHYGGIVSSYFNIIIIITMQIIFALLFRVVHCQ